MEESSSMKKTLGRRKIEMKKIGSKKNLQVTFSKRRNGLFKKAGELGALCGSEIAIIVQSPANKIFAFGHPSVESVIHKFETYGTYGSLDENITYVKNDYFEAMARLEEEKKIESAVAGNNVKFWWDEEIEGMELHELEEYMEALEKLLERVKEMEAAKGSEPQLPLASDTAVTLPSQNAGLDFDAFPDQIDYFMVNDEHNEETVPDFWHFDDDDLWC